MTTTVDELTGYVWLSRLVTVTGIGVPRMRQVMKSVGSVSLLYDASAESLSERVKAPPEIILRIRRFVQDDVNRKEAAEVSRRAASQGIGCMTETDAAFPSRLREIGSCPFLLFFMGDIERLLSQAENVVTIVGSRSPTGYGRTATRKIVSEIAGAGVTVVSGMARGIDSIAHRAALDAGGLTAAVLGGGIDHVYPPEHGDLMREIARKGVVVSEHGPGIRPSRPFFAARNRILSGLADCVAVTEASQSSGSMITAGFAADQGRDLFALPGSVFETQSRGCNQLIQEGAGILTCADDLLYRLPMGRMPRTAESEIRDMSLNLRMITVIDQLKGQSLNQEELSGATGLTMAELLPILSALEMVGDIDNRRGRFSLTPGL